MTGTVFGGDPTDGRHLGKDVADAATPEEPPSTTLPGEPGEVPPTSVPELP